MATFRENVDLLWRMAPLLDHFYVKYYYCVMNIKKPFGNDRILKALVLEIRLIRENHMSSGRVQCCLDSFILSIFRLWLSASKDITWTERNNTLLPLFVPDKYSFEWIILNWYTWQYIAIHWGFLTRWIHGLGGEKFRWFKKVLQLELITCEEGKQ